MPTRKTHGTSLSLPLDLGSQRPAREDPTPIPFSDGEAEELDPVCTLEFAHHARVLDCAVRANKR